MHFEMQRQWQPKMQKHVLKTHPAPDSNESQTLFFGSQAWRFHRSHPYHVRIPAFPKRAEAFIANFKAQNRLLFAHGFIIWGGDRRGR